MRFRSFFTMFGLFLAVPACTHAAAPAHAAPPAAEHPSFQVRVIGHGRPMILIPGYTCSGAVWNATVEHYRDRFALHVVTLSGFGGAPTPKPSHELLDNVRRELVGYISSEHLDRPVIIGHSMGGFMAYWIAATAPDRVGTVVAVDGVPFYSDYVNPGATTASSQPMAEKVRTYMTHQTPERFAQENRQVLATMITDPREVESVARDSTKSDPQIAAEAIYELMTTDLRETVASVRAPTLFLAAAAKDEAEKQEVVRRAEGQLARIPRHEIVIAPNGRHFVMLDATSFFFAQVDRFLGA